MPLPSPSATHSGIEHAEIDEKYFPICCFKSFISLPTSNPYARRQHSLCKQADLALNDLEALSLALRAILWNASSGLTLTSSHHYLTEPKRGIKSFQALILATIISLTPGLSNKDVFSLQIPFPPNKNSSKEKTALSRQWSEKLFHIL